MNETKIEFQSIEIYLKGRKNDPEIFVLVILDKYQKDNWLSFTYHSKTTGKYTHANFYLPNVDFYIAHPDNSHDLIKEEN